MDGEPIPDDLVKTALDGSTSARTWFGPPAGSDQGILHAGLKREWAWRGRLAQFRRQGLRWPFGG
jgi:hypothetical protein